MYLIHEGSHEKDSTAVGAEEVFCGEGVGKFVGIESSALVGYGDDEGFGGEVEGGGDVLVVVVFVAVDDGVDGGLADDHGEIAGGVFVEAGALSEVERGLFDCLDAFEFGLEREAHTACGFVSQAHPFRSEIAWLKCPMLEEECQGYGFGGERRGEAAREGPRKALGDRLTSGRGQARIACGMTTDAGRMMRLVRARIGP